MTLDKSRIIIKTMKALILLAEGFETVEALATIDIFKRSHRIDPLSASISSSKGVLSSQGILVQADVLLSEINPDEFDMIILPGGKKGVENLKKDANVTSLVRKFDANPNKEVHAICAAPSILRELGLLNERTYTCFPGFEGKEGTYTGEGVTIDDNLITGKSMGYTIPFALAIVERHFGTECVKEIEKGVYGKA